jgi:NSS family neurotransmitter:Na+ symporter
MQTTGRVLRKSDAWSSRSGFILAAVGSSIGLGNLWRFTYVTGEAGGGIFVLLYLAFTLLFALPLLAAEFAIGRRSGHSAIESVQAVARASRASELWGGAAWLGSMSSFFILTFYCVISSWIVAFLVLGLSADYSAASGGEAAVEAASMRFDRVTSNVPVMLSCLGGFVGMVSLVVGLGVKRGIERVSLVLTPVFFVLLISLLGFAALDGDFPAALSFIVDIRTENFTYAMMLEALGQSFFATGVGACVMMTYGAYLPRDTNIGGSASLIAGADTVVALVSALTVFSLVFATGGDPGAGPGLFFIMLPVGFDALPLGELFGGVFFLIALLAALASAISLMEVSVSWLDERTGVTRGGAAAGLGFAIFMIGAGYLFSRDYIVFMDFLTASIMLPLAGGATAFFCGWVVDRAIMEAELGPRIYRVWSVIVRWIIPTVIAAAIGLGVPDKLQNQGWIELPAVLLNVFGPNR